MKRYSGHFQSSNGVNKIAYYMTVPDVKPVCIVQLAHGMCENSLLYKRLMAYLTARGCVVCSNDFLGHGKSVSSGGDVGFFARNNGWRCIIRDMRRLTEIVSKRYPDLPVFLVGHSMGSFAAREYITWYGDNLSGCVLVGTSDGFENRKLLKLLARLMCLYENGEYRAPHIMKLGCEYLCGKMKNSSHGWEWLSRDEYIRGLMNRHSFDYTARAYYDIITLLDVISSPDWAYSIPAELPLLLMSGSCDPLGDCGRDVAKLYKRLRTAGCKDVKVRLYGGARHMLLHESNRDKIYGDLYNWIEGVQNRKADLNDKKVSGNGKNNENSRLKGRGSYSVLLRQRRNA